MNPVCPFCHLFSVGYICTCQYNNYILISLLRSNLKTLNFLCAFKIVHIRSVIT